MIYKRISFLSCWWDILRFSAILCGIFGGIRNLKYLLTSAIDRLRRWHISLRGNVRCVIKITNRIIKAFNLGKTISNKQKYYIQKNIYVKKTISLFLLKFYNYSMDVHKTSVSKLVSFIFEDYTFQNCQAGLYVSFNRISNSSLSVNRYTTTNPLSRFAWSVIASRHKRKRVWNFKKQLSKQYNEGYNKLSTEKQ